MEKRLFMEIKRLSEEFCNKTISPDGSSGHYLETAVRIRELQVYAENLIKLKSGNKVNEDLWKIVKNMSGILSDY